MTEYERLPRVTNILKDGGLIDTRWFTDAVRNRGTAVHAACHYLDEGDLDESTVDPIVTPYLDAYKRFQKDIGGKDWDWIECPQQDPLGRYRGTPDRILSCRPRALYDLKTGCHFAWHKYQTASYVNCLDDPFSYRRFALYLKKDGAYQVQEFPRSEYARDIAVFEAALTLWYAKREDKIC